MGDARAERIARTEVLRSSNFGTLEAYRQTGVVEKKMWLATPGTTGSRESHEELDGSVIGLNEEWTDPATGKKALHPGGFDDPASDCNCRCAVTAWIDDPGKAMRVKASRSALYRAHVERRQAWQRRSQKAVAGGLTRQRDAVMRVLRP